jgi:hypothetical protein
MKLSKAQKEKISYELQSFLTTFLSVFLIDGSMQLMALYNGDLSETAFLALLTAALRSAIKALIQILFPSIIANK